MPSSGGMWLWNANYIAMDMIKTQHQTFLNSFDPAYAKIPSDAFWLLDHTWTSRILFGSGVLLEAGCILAIGGRWLSFIIGVSLIAMHRSIDSLMGGVAFPYNELLDMIF